MSVRIGELKVSLQPDVAAYCAERIRAIAASTSAIPGQSDSDVADALLGAAKSAAEQGDGRNALSFVQAYAELVGTF